MRNEVYLIDCMDYIKTLSDNAFDLAIVDPWYGIPDKCSGAGKLKNRKMNTSAHELKEYDVKPGKEYFDALFRVSKNQIIWGGNYFELPPTRGFVAWDKCQPWSNFSACEYAWTSFDCPSKLFRFDNRTGGKIHAYQKPVELYKYLLKTFAKAGDTILDTHVGSGSIRIACDDFGLEFVGCEIKSAYWKLQEARYKTHISHLHLFEADTVQICSNRMYP